MTARRLGPGLRNTRSGRVPFRFDGKVMFGLPGDTLAAALLANDQLLVGRSFKYHRPRGILSAGPEEPNALVELREDAWREPNTRATTVELYDGLSAASQNRWPALKADVQSLNGLLSPLLVGGFYYKTFMWPASFWKRVYEPFIRKAAGLGRAAVAPDPDRYENAHVTADVLVVGGGVAGLAAARGAVEAGKRVVLVEERPWLGGQAVADHVQINGQPVFDWVADATAALDASPNCRIFTRTTATGLYENGVALAIERVSDHLARPPHGCPRQRSWTIRAGKTVLATGSIERPLVFPSNDLPGIMLSAAVRRYLTEFGVAVGQNIVIATDNDDGYLTAFQLADSGIGIPAVVDARRDPGAIRDQATSRGLKVIAGALPGRATGWHRVRSLDVADLNGIYQTTLACDAVAMAGGYTPAIHLATHRGAKPTWDAQLNAFVTPALPPDLLIVGSAAGYAGSEDVLDHGNQAGVWACDQGAHAPAPQKAKQGSSMRSRKVWRPPVKGKAFVDFQNDVTVKDLSLAQQEGYTSIEHTKRYTTLGMATDQGKTSNVNAIGIIAAARGVAPDDVGLTTFRPPFTPIALGALAGHARGRHLAPVRKTSLHDWHARHGASFVEAGQWLRPEAYPWAGESLMDAIAREARMVRQTVGLCDVSTLGKIDVFGPDAAIFLNRLYMNAVGKLPVGKARYGVMLREDGIVFDDGTVSRLAEDRFFVTTTTANAAPVLEHMEYYHQCVWPDLDVTYCSATDQWAAIALAGPKARDVLAAAFPSLDVSNDALPFMGILESRLKHIVLRIFRISFSGELAYEIAVPAGYGQSVWEHLIRVGEPYGIAPYGVEALSVLRIEKGHPAGGELDGRTTAGDLGLAGMMKKKSDFVGRALSTRPGLSDPVRASLVGVSPQDPDASLRAGAHLVHDPGTATTEDSLGWISSAHISPAMGHRIGIGFIKGGLEAGQKPVYAVFPLKNEVTRVDIVAPCFVDSEGERLRG